MFVESFEIEICNKLNDVKVEQPVCLLSSPEAKMGVKASVCREKSFSENKSFNNKFSRIHPTMKILSIILLKLYIMLDLYWNIVAYILLGPFKLLSI